MNTIVFIDFVVVLLIRCIYIIKLFTSANYIILSLILLVVIIICIVGININSKYGINDTGKQMTSDIGKITVYNENDLNKDKYLKNINKGDLVFFHTKIHL